jgi:N-acetylmuramoyl-L-alanine amidase
MAPGVISVVAAFCLLSIADPSRVIVLDPGHGGAKSGTKTVAGVSEASITLEIARVAREILEKNGVRVIMTRTQDTELALGSRVAIANDAHAAAFVSVHNNSAPVPERRGVETYILSPSSSDEATAALMAVENEHEGEEQHFGGGAAAPGEGGDPLASILDDLSRTAAHQDSALLARAVQDSLGRVKGLGPSRGLRQAPFKVLRGAKMPAVLVEIGYLSHPTQGEVLSTSRGQRLAGEALAKGVLRFLAQRSTAADDD